MLGEGINIFNISIPLRSNSNTKIVAIKPRYYVIKREIWEKNQKNVENCVSS
jgi:hypothetical protein